MYDIATDKWTTLPSLPRICLLKREYQDESGGETMLDLFSLNDRYLYLAPIPYYLDLDLDCTNGEIEWVPLAVSKVYPTRFPLAMN
jgi:hypothetical protein